MTWSTPWGYQMWTCGECSAYGIAADLVRCPHCGKERAMPRTPAGAEPTNGPGLPDEPAGTPPPKRKPAAKPQPAADGKKEASDG